jgi:hypothetical protein
MTNGAGGTIQTISFFADSMMFEATANVSLTLVTIFPVVIILDYTPLILV